MSGRVNLELAMGDGSPLLELFEACKIGDLQKVKRLVSSQRESLVNSRDKEGRKSTCLHFAAGKLKKQIWNPSSPSLSTTIAPLTTSPYFVSMLHKTQYISAISHDFVKFSPSPKL